MLSGITGQHQFSLNFFIMNRFLLSAIACSVSYGAFATAPALNKVWDASATLLSAADKVAYNSPVAVDADGNMIAAGNFDINATFGDVALSADDFESYIVKYDKTGVAKWAVSISLGATVKDITTDANGNIFVAGSFADEVTFGTTSGETITKEGAKIDGDFTPSQNASFIAKYDANGVLKQVQTFVPEPLPVFNGSESYFPMDGDVFFRINHIEVSDNGVYASAIYTGKTTVGNTSFEGSYNDFLGFMFLDLKSSAILKCDADLSGCSAVATYGVDTPLATEDDQYQAGVATFGIKDNNVYAVFSGNGPLTISSGEYNEITLDAEPSSYNYLLAEITESGELGEMYPVACPESGFQTNYIPAIVTFSGENMLVAGSEPFAENYGTPEERLSNRLFVITAPLANFEAATTEAKEIAEGKINYNGIKSAAALADGTIYLSTLGYYSDVEGDNKKGDFAGTVKTFSFSAGEFAPVAVAENAIGVAAAEDYVAFATENGVETKFSLFNTSDSAVDDILSYDANAPVEYFNLQGQRVANPSEGVFIRRQGSKATKIMVK